ncbi:MAG: YdeI/OmpD-associated family protein [Candidatus Pacebacteria bacterium]|nr:YdeI/OmpD-associated family protein [Candidatus Paceibacterota bacterium]
MDFGKTLYVENREKWHSWLSKNHKTESEIWLIYYYKKTGKPRISYDDAVMEALCFGWIDSILKKIDTERFAQRFSPRKPKSELSQMNKERICELIKEKKMTEWGMKAIAHVFNEKTDKTDNFIIPLDILKKLKANKDAWEYFQKMPPSYQRIRIAYIESRKRQSINMYKKSLDHFIEMTAKNKRIGFVRERRDSIK